MDDDRALSCPRPWRAPDGAVNSSGSPTGHAVTIDDDLGTGLLLPSRQARVAAGVVLAVVGAGLGVAAGFLIARGGVAAFAGVVLGLLGLLLFAAGAFALWRKQRTTGILLTADHVVFNWVHPAVRLSWSEVAELRPLNLRIGRARTAPSHNYLGLVAPDSTPANARMHKVAERFGKDISYALPMRSIDVDQLVVLHTLRFYLDHPEARGELAGEDAVRRVREARY